MSFELGLILSLVDSIYLVSQHCNVLILNWGIITYMQYRPPIIPVNWYKIKNEPWQWLSVNSSCSYIIIWIVYLYIECDRGRQWLSCLLRSLYLTINTVIHIGVVYYCIAICVDWILEDVSKQVHRCACCFTFCIAITDGPSFTSDGPAQKPAQYYTLSWVTTPHWYIAMWLWSGTVV